MKLRDVLHAHRDQIIAAGVAVLFVAEILFSTEVDEHKVSAALVGVLMCALLGVRRTLPLLPLVGLIVVIQLNHTVLVGMGEGGSFMVVIILSIYSAGSYARGRVLVLCGAIVAGLIPLALSDPHQDPQIGDAIFFLVFFGTPFVAGIIFRRRRERDVEMTTLAARAEAESAARAVEAVEAERARIARELHDVVSHAISVIVVQSRGGRRVLPPGSDEARGAFDTIEHAGEQALVEMRRLLSLLRDVESAPERSPQPGLRRLEALASEVRTTGLPVEIVREGDPVELPPGLDLSAYRIVQEALTNAVKHAGPARARVVVRYTPDELELEVQDDGDGSGGGGGSGHGLDGIRERVEVYGGLLEAGEGPTGGFVVRARLPLGTGL
ncbi:MAG: hypothetical protein QOG79_2364 [Mycobacterium sp.]|jgi:signal transduction histidine kinase|nr:hypothetical protein [Mycobacterium sp.]